MKSPVSKRQLVLVAICLVAGGALSHWLLPRTRIEVRTVEVETVRVVRDETVRDHTVTTTTRVEDKGIVKTTTVTKADVETDSRDRSTADRTKTASETRETGSRDSWQLGVVASGTLGTPGLTWGAEARYRVVGPVWVGGALTTSGSWLGSLAVGF